MPPAPSSFYSQDDRTRANLGYTPFEYWKGPKPVVWASTRAAPVHNRLSIAKPKSHGRRLSSSRAAARISAKSHLGGPVNSLRLFEPIQPSKLYSAQQFVESLQAAKLADTKHDRHPHVEYPYVGSRGDIGQFRASSSSGDKKKPATSSSSGSSSNPWGDPDDKGRLKRLEAIRESAAQRGWADASYSHHGDYNRTPAGARTSHQELLLLSRTQSFRSSPPDYADLPPLNMSRRNLPPRYGYYGDEHPDRWWDPSTWRRRTWAILVAVMVVFIIVLVIVLTMLQKNNAYPNYKRLVYTLSDEYSGPEFFDNFDYFTGYDPTHGFVHYVPREQAEALNLTYAGASSAVLRVDTSVGPSSTPDASTGRFSVRATSKRQYGSAGGGLFVFDIKHTPYGCGTWPALWLADPSRWPDNGEMDVMEATNLGDAGNAVTLHTGPGCGMDHRRKMTGDAGHASCVSSGADNRGCGVDGPAESYGAAFNAGGGGVVALEWRSAGIRVWQFPRAGIPADITAGGGAAPDPSTWGTALADFPGTGCDIDGHFRNQSIILNIDLCGDLAGSLYGGTSCPSNCTDFVANNPDEFVNAYWEVGAFRVYTAA